MLYQVLQSYANIVKKGSQVKFLWVPAHVGIRGNERADELAKNALKKGSIVMQVDISKSEAKCTIWEKVNHMWQERWDREEKGRHLHNIQKSVRVDRKGSGLRRNSFDQIKTGALCT